MFGKMMNNYYYGKSGKGDYRKEDLPTNRWQLFGEMLRIRLSGLMRLNLMYAVPWIPAIIVMLLCGLSWYSSLANLVETYAQDAPALSAAMSQLNTSLLFTMSLWLIPCLVITGPFTAGVAYVTRNWARDEHAFVWGDFKDAVKENWKQALGVSALTSLVPLVVVVCWTFYGRMAVQTPLMMAPQMISLMLGLVWALMLIYLYPLMVTYQLTFKQLLRNAFLLAIGRLPQSLGLRLATLLPLLIGFGVAYFIGQIHWVVFALLIYYALIGFALSRFAFASYANAVFDRYINVHIEGAQVNR
ncbi:MAG: YesL family protein, partial [Clostridia bacterium]|nr:YesL family protein [Clostridia bacterium]